MKIYVTAKPRSRKEYIKKTDNTHYTVAVKEQPVGGKANQAIIKSLSEFFHKPSSQIYIINGETCKQKIVEVPVSADELKDLDIQKKLF